MSTDKIINNRYKTGDLEFEEFGEMKIDPDRLSKLGLRDNRSDKLKEIEKEIYEVYEESTYFERFQNPKEKIKKHEIVEIYFYFFDRLKNPHIYSSIEKFIGIAEFFNMNYNILYKSIGIVQQAEILKEAKAIYPNIDPDSVTQLF